MEHFRVGRCRVVVVAVLVAVTVVLAAPAAWAEGDLRCEGHPFVENVYPTTRYGPAAADLVWSAAYNPDGCATPSKPSPGLPQAPDGAGD